MWNLSSSFDEEEVEDFLKCLQEANEEEEEEEKEWEEVEEEG